MRAPRPSDHEQYFFSLMSKKVAIKSFQTTFSCIRITTFPVFMFSPLKTLKLARRHPGRSLVLTYAAPSRAVDLMRPRQPTLRVLASRPFQVKCGPCVTPYSFAIILVLRMGFLVQSWSPYKISRLMNSLSGHS